MQSNLLQPSHFSVPPVLSQPPFLRFFCGFLIVIPIFKKYFLLKCFVQNTVMLDRVNNKQISTKRSQTTVMKHWNTWVYFVQSLICLYCDINTQDKLCLKVLCTVRRHDAKMIWVSFVTFPPVFSLDFCPIWDRFFDQESLKFN